MLNKSRKTIGIFIYLLVSFLIVSSLYGIYRWQSNLHLAERQDDLTRSYNAVMHAHAKTVSVVYLQIFNQPALLGMMRSAASENAAIRDSVRNRLYQQLLPVYRNLAAENNLKQMHLHLPGGISLLRMHKPAEYGDELYPIRPLIRSVQEHRRPMHAFESGKHGVGFRFVFPLIEENQLLGSVEISLGFQAIRSELEILFAGEYFQLLKRNGIEHKMNHEERSGFVPSIFGEDLIQERFNDNSSHERHLPPQILDRIARDASAQVSEQLDATNRAAVLVRTGLRHYQCYLIPIMDSNGDVQGYLGTATHSSTIDSYFIHMLLTAAGALSLLAVLQWLLLRLFRFSGQLRSTNHLFQSTIDALPYPFYVVDVASYQIRICNSLANSGKLPEGITCHLLTHHSSTPCDDSKHPCPMKRVIECRKPVIVEHIHYDDAGEQRHVEVHGYPIFDKDGAIEDVIEYSIDITERKEAESRLVTMAESDHLTGCHNRRKLYQLLEIEIKRARRNERPLALLMLDLDHFKSVNDRFGHDQGDAVLRHVTVTIQDALRQTDILGRFGGEEFLVLLPESDLRYAMLIAERLRKNLASHPAERVGMVTLSIGIAVLHADDGSDSLIKRADEALYLAKQNGRDRYECKNL